VTSLLLSNGGAQLLHIACIAGNVTPCKQHDVREILTTELSEQGCALPELGHPRGLTFVLGRLENLCFFIEIICWAHWISKVQRTELCSIFLGAQPCRALLFKCLCTCTDCKLKVRARSIKSQTTLVPTLCYAYISHGRIAKHK